MAFRLRCPVCRKAFAYEPGTAYPDECPLCETYIGSGRKDDDVVMPFIRSSTMKSIDGTYREVEKSSEHRAEQAAQMAGVPVSEMSDLKITNLRDARHPGDVAAVPVQNDVSRFMEQTGIGGFRGVDGSGYSAAVQTGPSPNVGARMRTALQAQHGVRTGGAISDCPALETTQPTYRRRG